MRKPFVSAWLPVAGWVAVIVAFSSVPDLGTQDVGLPGVDKLAHLGEYGVLGFLYARARGRAGIAWWWAALVGLGLGALDEMYQTRIPGRDSSWRDAVADAAGAALGALVYRARSARKGR